MTTGTPIGAELALAIVASLDSLTPEQERLLFERDRAADEGVAEMVRAIVADVRVRGDEALREMALRFDGAELDTLEVPRERWEVPLSGLDPDLRQALEQAAESIRIFHRAQLPRPLEIEVSPGVRLGRRTEPLARVGVYAPGGTAAYPSSVLMGVVPARVAGVGEVVVCSPPGPSGLPADAVLAACALAGADRCFALGGAGAVAALAWGTATVPRVDKIVGPGNAYVSEAKLQLAGRVAFDSPAGPSEVLIVADESAEPALVAAELMAQAEHDPAAAAVLVSTDPTLPARVEAALRDAAPRQPRVTIIAAALAARGALLTAADLAAALRFAERYAPEHLALMVREPRAALERVRAAGTVFLGAPSSVAFGDYLTGANHVLPTHGTARAFSGLSVSDFLRAWTYQEVTPTAAARLSAPTRTLALAEGLDAHAYAAVLRADPSAALSAPTKAPPPAARAAYREVVLYDPGRRPCAVDLSDNTSLFGVPPSAARALLSMPAERITRYPSVYADELKRALAAKHGVAAENVVTGCGSDDVLDSLVRAFCEPGEAVAYADPTFGMVPAFAHMNAAVPGAVPHGPGMTLPLDGLLATAAAVVYVCRPNNPTGTQYGRIAMERLAAEATGVVVVDEAYADFADDDLVALAVRSTRLVVVRTLSKAYGLAGLRVGYAIGPAALVREIEKSRGPYKVSGVAEAAALAALADDAEWVAAKVRATVASRARLAEGLQARGVPPLDSEANFLLVPLPTPASATEWAVALRARGVAVRPFPALVGIGDSIRVSVGPWPLMERFLEALDGVRGERSAAAAATVGTV